VLHEQSLLQAVRRGRVALAAGCALLLFSCESREGIATGSLARGMPVLAVFLSPDPAHPLNPVQSLLAELQSNPNYPPPKVAEGTPLARFEVKISGGDRMRVQDKGILRDLHGGSLQSRTALEKVGRRTGPPDYLVIVIDGKGKPVYWVGVSDPTRILVESVTDARSGQIQGSVVKVKEGLLTATVPYVAGGTVQLLGSQPGQPLIQARPLATAAFGPVAPPPPRRGAP